MYTQTLPALPDCHMPLTLNPKPYTKPSWTTWALRLWPAWHGRLGVGNDLGYFRNRRKPLLIEGDACMKSFLGLIPGP